jgi:energy-coupling factor transport system permease protein
MPNLNTITWTAWMLSGVLIISLTYNPPYLAVMLIILLTLAHQLKNPPTGHVKTGVLFSIPLLLINTLFIHTGEHVIATIPAKIADIPLPLIAGPITLESIYAAFVFMLLMIDMLLLFMVYQNQTTPDALLRLAPKSLSHSALLTAIALRFLPTLAADVHSISEANRSRGLRLENTPLPRKIRNHGSLIIPALVNSLERSYNLAESLSSRGYGGGRTRYASEEWTRRDKALTLLYTLIAATTLALRVLGRLAFWNPLQIEGVFGLPPANPLILVALLSLILPGVER